MGIEKKIMVATMATFAGLATFFAFGLGGVAAFRFLVEKWDENAVQEGPVKETDSVARNVLLPEADRTHESFSASTSIQGTRTQFDPVYGDEGKSACTYICLEAAKQLLQAESIRLTPSFIDGLVDCGVEGYRQRKPTAYEHASLEEIAIPDGLSRQKFHDPFSIADGPYQGLVSNFDQLLQNAASQLEAPYALVLTKAPETVLVVCRSPNEYWFFDSHGKEGSKAYIEKYAGQAEIVAALKLKFPYLASEDGLEDLQVDLLYNAFDAYALQLSKS